jgi:hypothetical protein
MSHFVRLLPLALLVLTACPNDPEGPPDAGEQEVPDLCNSQEEALSSSECQLVLGQEMERYISFGGDQDWYSVQMPSTVGVRSLVRVTALYATSATAVNLSVKFQRENGTALVTEKVDMHGQGQPRPIEFTIPFTEPGARLLLLISDKPSNPSRPGFDARNPYILKVEVLENPDSLEPNDTAATATPVALTNQNGVLVGSGSGFLATPGDVDRFSFNVPAGKLVYVHLTAPYLAPPQQPPAYIFSYKLLRPDQTAEVDRRVRTNVVAVDLAAARRVATAGTWQVLVQAWDSDGPGNEPPPGDVRLQYTLDVRVMDEVDPNDKSGGNEEMARARVGVFDKGAPPAKVTTPEFTGRLGSEGDLDWYAVDVPAHTAPSVLHYRLVSLAGTGGRFPALPEVPNRLVRVLTEMPGFSATDCVTRAEVCPKGYGANRALFEPLVTGWCNQRTPLCLHSSREESEYFSNLRNFEGTLPVASHTTNVRYYFLVQDEGTNWAEDKDYRLEVEWLADPDEASPSVGSKPLASHDGTGFPNPPTGEAYEVYGSISHGLGRLVNNDPVRGQGVRGPTDYDAVPTDVDTFNFSLPSSLPVPMDRTWELQWDVENLPDGGTPYGLALDLTFCDADRPDGGASCTPVSTGSAGQPLTLAYRGDSLRAWHSPAGSLSNLQPLFRSERSGGVTRVTVQPYACSCLEPRFLRGGTLKVAVSGVDRLDYGQANYTLRTAHTSYPRPFTTTDGGTAMCPRPADAGVAADGGALYTPGCVFSRQP